MKRVVVCGAVVLAGVATSAQAPALPDPPIAARIPAAGSTPAPPATAGTRTFSLPVGLLFTTVRPDRMADFERVIGDVQQALANSRDPAVQAQARGWRMFKAAEPGPGGTVLYVFVMDPAVPGADYGFGPILAAAYPDPAKLQEVWTRYTGAVTSGGTLLNLAPVMPDGTDNR